jgi:hypothetical protein
MLNIAKEKDWSHEGTETIEFPGYQEFMFVVSDKKSMPWTINGWIYSAFCLIGLSFIYRYYIYSKTGYI